MLKENAKAAHTYTYLTRLITVMYTFLTLHSHWVMLSNDFLAVISYTRITPWELWGRGEKNVFTGQQCMWSTQSPHSDYLDYKCGMTTLTRHKLPTLATRRYGTMRSRYLSGPSTSLGKVRKKEKWGKKRRKRKEREKERKQKGVREWERDEEGRGERKRVEWKRRM